MEAVAIVIIPELNDYKETSFMIHAKLLHMHALLEVKYRSLKKD